MDDMIDGKIVRTVQREKDLSVSDLESRYDEFSEDNPHNQALKTVLTRLLGHAARPEAKGAVNSLLRRMADISSRPCSVSSLANLMFDRITRPWRPVFERAAWFLRGLYPDVHAGSSESVCLLFDMERLFEAFVGVLIRQHWRDSGARVVLQGPRQHFAHSSIGPAFEMRPDATIIASSRNPERIYDAKWKRLDATTQNAGVNRSDIYQMASYASGYGCRHVTLVFPSSDKVAAGLVETFEISDPYASRVDVFALDLHALALGQLCQMA
jgi:5-methylcytosine-specific restriction enzyme subunit McrC